jgi:hypothetical protein
LPLLKSDEERNSKEDYYHSVKCHPWLVLQK